VNAEPATSAPVPPTGWRRVVLRIAHAVEPEGEPAEVIYGTLIAAAVLATKAHKGESGARVWWSALLVLALYWLAHVYADVVGERLRTRTRPGWKGIVNAALRDWGMLRGALIPVAVFGLVRLFGAAVNAAALTALWVTILLLACWGLVAALRGGARGLELAAETLVCAALGFLVLLLKSVIH
jgi:hypothetical protein